MLFSQELSLSMQQDALFLENASNMLHCCWALPSTRVVWRSSVICCIRYGCPRYCTGALDEISSHSILSNFYHIFFDHITHDNSSGEQTSCFRGCWYIVGRKEGTSSTYVQASETHHPFDILNESRRIGIQSQ